MMPGGWYRSKNLFNFIFSAQICDYNQIQIRKLGSLTGFWGGEERRYLFLMSYRFVVLVFYVRNNKYVRDSEKSLS